MSERIEKYEPFGRGFLKESIDENNRLIMTYCDQNKNPMPFAKNCQKIAVFSNGYYLVKMRGFELEKVCSIFSAVDIKTGKEVLKTIELKNPISDCYVYCDDKGKKIHSFPFGYEYCFFEYKKEIYMIQKREDKGLFYLADQNAKLIQTLEDVVVDETGDVYLFGQNDTVRLDKKKLEIKLVSTIFETEGFLWQKQPMLRQSWQEKKLDNGDVLFHSPMGWDQVAAQLGHPWSENKKKRMERLYSLFPEFPSEKKKISKQETQKVKSHSANKKIFQNVIIEGEYHIKS